MERRKKRDVFLYMLCLFWLCFNLNVFNIWYFYYVVFILLLWLNLFESRNVGIFRLEIIIMWNGLEMWSVDGFDISNKIFCSSRVIVVVKVLFY